MTQEALSIKVAGEISGTIDAMMLANKLGLEGKRLLRAWFSPEGELNFMLEGAA